MTSVTFELSLAPSDTQLEASEQNTGKVMTSTLASVITVCANYLRAASGKLGG